MSFTLKEEKFDSTEHVDKIFNILKDNDVNYKKLYKDPDILNELIETYCESNNISKHFDKVKNVLSITQLVGVIQSYDSVKDAIDSFSEKEK